MQISDNKTIFILMHLVFYEIDTYHSHLDCNLLGESNNTMISKTFYLQLLNKYYEYLE